VKLEDHCEIAVAQLVQALGRKSGHVFALVQYLPRIRREQGGQHVQKGRLAGAGAAHDADELTGLQSEAHLAQGQGPTPSD
jgi:hypothetical protein